jgi:hypothetical protein
MSLISGIFRIERGQQNSFNWTEEKKREKRVQRKKQSAVKFNFSILTLIILKSEILLLHYDTNGPLQIKTLIGRVVCLRLGVGSTSLLAGNSVNGVHVVVTHVSPLSCLILGFHGDGEVLFSHCASWKEGGHHGQK